MFKRDKLLLLLTFILPLILFRTSLCLAVTEDRNLFSRRGKKIAPVSKEKEAISIKDPSLIKIPQEVGSVKDQFIGNGDLFIVHIQDAHCNYEAQMNNAKILEKLIKEYNLELIGVEGSAGIIDTTPFASFPDKEVRAEVADYFVKKGKITGPEFLSITEDLPFTLYGVETERYYARNYDAFLKAINFKEFAQKCCYQIKNTLEKLKLKIFSPELKEIDNIHTLFNNQQMNFIEYSTNLEKWSKKHSIRYEKYKNFKNQVKLKKLEKEIVFDTVEKERELLIKKLLSLGGKKGAKSVVSKSLEFKLQKISAVEYYEYLLNNIKEHKLNKKDYANLISYLDYIRLSQKIKPSELFEEVDKLTEDIKEKLYQNKTQKELSTRLKNIRIMDNLFTLEVPKNEYLYYKKHKELFQTEYFLSFIRAEAPQFSIPFNFDPKVKNIDRKINIIESFYDIAIERDNILVRNLIKQMGENKKLAVLITGGFHTAGITEILRKRNISYLVVSPKITKEDTENPYVSIMLEQKSYMR